MNNEILLALQSFGVTSDNIECAPLGNGHINVTYLCVVDNEKKYVLQKINNYVFKDVNLLMNNYFKVTNYLYENKIETIHLIQSTDGKPYSKINDSYYRLYDYIDNAVCYEKITD